MRLFCVSRIGDRDVTKGPCDGGAGELLDLARQPGGGGPVAGRGGRLADICDCRQETRRAEETARFYDR